MPAWLGGVETLGLKAELLFEVGEHKKHILCSAQVVSENWDFRFKSPGLRNFKITGSLNMSVWQPWVDLSMEAKNSQRTDLTHKPREIYITRITWSAQFKRKLKYSSVYLRDEEAVEAIMQCNSLFRRQN